MQELITEKINIWASSVESKKSGGRGRSSNAELSIYGIKKLRELILQLAVQGKLIPQDPTHEPASKLIDRISNERDHLIKKGKVRGVKKQKSISNKEHPFEIPVSWEWARLKDISFDLGQKKPDEKFTYIDVGSIDQNRGLVSDSKILEPDEAPSRARKLVDKNTVIYSTVRPYLLNIAVIENDIKPTPIVSTAFAVLHPFLDMEPRYIYLYLRSKPFINYVESQMKGLAYPAVNDKNFFNGIIPVPPYEEQKRIVERVDELMAYCDELEKGEIESIETHKKLVKALLKALVESNSHKEFKSTWKMIVDNFEMLFTTTDSVEELKKCVLDLAVRGKLVEQGSKDGIVTELIANVAEEKKEFSKANKSKLKPLSPIDKKEIPFSLPDRWCWVRLDALTLSTEYGSSAKSKPSGKIPVIRMGNLQNGEIDWDNLVYTSDEEEIQKYKLSKNTVLFNRTNSPALVGKTSIYRGERPAIFAGYLIRVNLSKYILPDYINLVLNSPYARTHCFKVKTDGVSQSNINAQKLRNIPIPVCSFELQQETLKKVEGLVSQIDNLRGLIVTRSAFARKLADSITQHI